MRHALADCIWAIISAQPPSFLLLQHQIEQLAWSQMSWVRLHEGHDHYTVGLLADVLPLNHAGVCAMRILNLHRSTLLASAHAQHALAM